jgi:hypothetical protein
LCVIALFQAVTSDMYASTQQERESGEAAEVGARKERGG